MDFNTGTINEAFAFGSGITARSLGTGITGLALMIMSVWAIVLLFKHDPSEHSSWSNARRITFVIIVFITWVIFILNHWR